MCVYTHSVTFTVHVLQCHAYSVHVQYLGPCTSALHCAITCTYVSLVLNGPKYNVH